MYLRECLIENVGPIELLDLSMPFNEDGTPKPIVLVGKNGSGKSIFLSHIADALVEFAKPVFRDIVPYERSARRPYFKFVGPTNQRIGAEFGFALLRFGDNEKDFTYVDKTGALEPEPYIDRLKGRFGDIQNWPAQGNHKSVSPRDKDFFEAFFGKATVCYFPPSRRENPHWLNPESIDDRGTFTFEQRLTGVLGKPVLVETCADNNRAWLFDIILDSMVDIDSDDKGALIAVGNVHDKLLLRQSRGNVEALLKKVLQDEDARFMLSYRNVSPYRLSIASGDRVIIPTLSHLSSGQAVLFNLFSTVIRYADKGDINKSMQLQEIQGIVLIDELDAHLHSELQYEVLPTLIRLFPKVQFIVTSHAPLFLLGMENTYGQDGFQIVEMPDGNPIATERFSEFVNSINYYRSTRAYEDALREALSERSRPLVLTEGETDPIYIETALELMGRADLLEQVSVEWVGGVRGSNAFNTGQAGLNATRNVIEANPSLLRHKLLLLYDCDTNK